VDVADDVTLPTVELVSVVGMLATVLAALSEVDGVAVLAMSVFAAVVAVVLETSEVTTTLAAVVDPDATELMTPVPVVVETSAVVADVSVREADDDTGTGVVITEAAAVVEVGSVDAAVESVAEEAGAAVVPLTIVDTAESVGAIVDATDDETTTIVPVDEAADTGVETTEGVAVPRMDVIEGKTLVSVTLAVALEIRLDSTDEIEEMTPVAETDESVDKMLDSTDRIDDSIDGTADGSAVDRIEVATEARLDSTDEIEDRTDEGRTEVGSIVGKVVGSERIVVGKRTAVVVVGRRPDVVSVKSRTLELVREDISDKIDDTGIERTIELGTSDIFGMLAVVAAMTSDVVEAAKDVVTSETTELAMLETSESTEVRIDVGSTVLTMLDASESTEVKIDVGSIVMAMTLELGESEITDRIEEMGNGTTVAVEVVAAAVSELASDGVETGTVTDEVSSELVGTSTEVGTGKIDVRMPVRPRLEVGVGNSKTEVAGVLEGATVMLAMPVEVLSVMTGTPDEVAIVIATTLDVGTITTIDDVGVTSMTEEVSGTGAMLDKTLANDEAAEAADPDVTAVAALLKTDCRLESTEATEAALLSGRTDVRLVKGSTVITDEVMTGRTEVTGRSEVTGRTDVTGRTEVVALSTTDDAVAGSTEVSVSVTETADEVASGAVEAVSDDDTSLVVSGNVELVRINTDELVTGRSVSVAEVVVGTSDVASRVDVAKVASLLVVAVAATVLEICD
jgi:hypothetical protein